MSNPKNMTTLWVSRETKERITKRSTKYAEQMDTILNNILDSLEKYEKKK